MNATTITIGNVLRADIRGFVVASRIPEPEVPTFGAFVHADIQQEQAQLVGLVYDIRLLDDPFLRGIAAMVSEDQPGYAEMIADQREVRMVPVEISVASVAYRNAGGCHYGFPPQPPMILHRIRLCDDAGIAEITARPDFMRTLLQSPNIPADELIAVALNRAASLRPAGEREDYLLTSARYLARYLAGDPMRLETILRRLAEIAGRPA